MSDNCSSHPSQTSERVVLVHGTFASSEKDLGEAWWQVGSEAYESLQERLPRDVSLAAEGDVFRWSGHNTERARSKAAAKLLRYLKPLEESGQPYHLIGHSHGGSVIWSALRLANAHKRKLNHLKSWSTVGTPFLQHQTKSPWNPINILYLILAGMLLHPAWRSVKGLVLLCYDAATGSLETGIILKPDAEVGFVSAIARVPFLKGMELLGVVFTPTEHGMRMGSYDASSTDSFGHFLFGTIEGWLILSGIVLFGYIMLLLSSFFLSTVLEGWRISQEKRLEQEAFEHYRTRWLGIWSQDDEAINGLRATLQLSMSFIGDWSVRERIFLSDLISVPWQPVNRLFAPLYNRAIRPFLDSTVRDIVIKTAQGNDRPAAFVVAVSPHPIHPDPEETVPPLPESLQDQIRGQADRQANELGPKLRMLLAQPSLTVGLEGFSQTLSGKELVHTSYFDHPEVLELLAMNISSSRNRTRPRRSSISVEISHWFDDFKRIQGVSTDRDRHKRSTNISLGSSPDDTIAA